MDIDTFKTLKAVVEEGSFAKAAARLHKAQSAVSYQIKKLEEHLNQAIFNRQGYRAELTDTGKVMLNEGEKLLKQYAYIESLAQQHKDGWEPRLELVIDGVLPITPVLKALKHLDEARVPTSIQLSVEYLQGVQQRFEENNAQVMLAKDFTPKENWTAIALPEVTTLLVVAKGHPLLENCDTTQEKLSQYAELIVRDGQQKVQSSTVSGQPLSGNDQVYFFSDFMQKKQALLMGLGYGWMPSYLIADELLTDTLQPITHLKNYRQKIVPYLIYRNDLAIGKTQEKLVTHLTEEFAKLR